MMASVEALSLSRGEEDNKEDVLSFITTDDKRNNSQKEKRRSYVRSSSDENKIIFLDIEDNIEFMGLKPREISPIIEQEQKYLCLEYGPKRKPMFVLLDFTDKSRDCLDEWNIHIRRVMGFECIRPRRNTANTGTISKPSKKAHKERTRSALQPTTTPILEMPSLAIPPQARGQAQTPEVESPVFQPPSAPMTNDNQSPSAGSPQSECSSDLSPFGSLKSVCSNNPPSEELDFSLNRLSMHTFKDHRNDIIVTKSLPESKLNVGDIVELKDGPSPMNARGLREHMQATVLKTVTLCVTRGVRVTLTDGEHELLLKISGPKTRRPNAVDVAMATCSTNTCDESRLVIADINDIPVAVGTKSDQVAQRLRHAQLNTLDGQLELRLVPQSLMTTDEQADELDIESNNDLATITPQETRHIDVGSVSHHQGDNDSNNHEETDC